VFLDINDKTNKKAKNPIKDSDRSYTRHPTWGFDFLENKSLHLLSEDVNHYRRENYQVKKSDAIVKSTFRSIADVTIR